MTLEQEIEILLQRIVPTIESNRKRCEILDYVAKIIKPTSIPGCQVCCIGSTALRAYLPEGDIDVILIHPGYIGGSPSDSGKQALFAVFTELFNAVESASNPIPRSLNIRNVEFVNARTSVVNCTINNCKVDITINQIGGVATTAFLEECARAIGNNNLFKRSLILIKCWCINESHRYCGQSICGSKQGMLSSYALSVMILFLINKVSHCSTPFAVMWTFFHFYSHFEWNNYALSVNGLVPLSAIHNGTYFQSLDEQSSTSRPSNGSIDLNGVVETTQARMKQFSAIGGVKQSASAGGNSSKSFLVKPCNIIDPVNSFNNLGISVARQNLAAIGAALSQGRHHLDSLCSRPSKPPLSKGSNSHNGTSSSLPTTNGSSGSGPNQRRPSASSVDVITAGLPAVNTNMDESLSARTSPSAASATAQLWSAVAGSSSGSAEDSGRISSGSASTLIGIPVDKDFVFPDISAPIHGVEDYWLLNNFFPLSMRLYFSDDQIRADLRDHPMQLGTSSTYIPSTSGQLEDGERRRSSSLLGSEASIFDVDEVAMWSVLSEYDQLKMTAATKSTLPLPVDLPATVSGPINSGDHSTKEIVVPTDIDFQQELPADPGNDLIESRHEVVSVTEISVTPSPSILNRLMSPIKPPDLLERSEVPVATGAMASPLLLNTTSTNPAPASQIAGNIDRAPNYSELYPASTDGSTVSLAESGRVSQRHGGRGHVGSSVPVTSFLTGSETDSEEASSVLDVSSPPDYRSKIRGSGSTHSVPSSNISTFYSNSDTKATHIETMVAAGITGLRDSASVSLDSSPARSTADIQKPSKNKRVRSRGVSSSKPTRSGSLNEVGLNSTPTPTASIVGATGKQQVASHSGHSTLAMHKQTFGIVGRWIASIKDIFAMDNFTGISEILTPKFWGLQNYISKFTCKVMVSLVTLVVAVVLLSSSSLATRLQLFDLQRSELPAIVDDIVPGVFHALLSRRPHGTYQFYHHLQYYNQPPISSGPILAQVSLSCGSSLCLEGNCTLDGDLRCSSIASPSSTTILQKQIHKESKLKTNEKLTSEIPSDIPILPLSGKGDRQRNVFEQVDNTGLVPDDDGYDEDSIRGDPNSLGRNHKERIIHWLSEGSNITLGVTEGSTHRATNCYASDSVWARSLPHRNAGPVLPQPTGNEQALVPESTVSMSDRFELSGRSVWRYTWFRDNDLLGSDPESAVLAIRNISRDDSGRYKCVKTWVGANGEYCEHRVVDTYIFVSVPPYSTTKARYLQVERGSQVYFQLSAHGSPSPSFQWMRNGIILPDQRRSALVISAVNDSHIGTYSCLMTNVAGSFVWLEATVFCT